MCFFQGIYRLLTIAIYVFEMRRRWSSSILQQDNLKPLPL